MNFTELHFNKIDNAWVVTYGHQIGLRPPSVGEDGPQPNIKSGSLAFPNIRHAAEWILENTAPPATKSQQPPAKEKE